MPANARSSDTRRDPGVWRSFVRASLGIAIVAGFGLGAALFLTVVLDVPLRAWWVAAVYAHGHAQIFGWAGLMVLGVAFHFLPRLVGASLHRAEWARPVLWLLAGGIILRTVAQPGLAAAEADWSRDIARFALALSGLLELAGASLAIWLLGSTMRSGLAARKHTEMRAVIPFFATSFAGLWIALAVNAVALIRAAASGRALVTPSTDRTVLVIAFYLFLIPVAVAMAVRTFPLYFRTPAPKQRLLRAGLALLLAGAALRVTGDEANRQTVSGAGQILLALAIVAFVVGLGLLARRLPLPRRSVNPLHDPIQLLALSAFGWLLVAAGLLLLRGSDALSGPGWPAPLDAEWHALGAGFVTPLILGVGAHLLPGFARSRLRSIGLVWVTLLLANLAAVLRVGPVVVDDQWSATLSHSMKGSAGVIAIATLVIFAINVGIFQSAPEPKPAGKPVTD